LNLSKETVRTVTQTIYNQERTLWWSLFVYLQGRYLYFVKAKCEHQYDLLWWVWKGWSNRTCSFGLVWKLVLAGVFYLQASFVLMAVAVALQKRGTGSYPNSINHY